MARLGLPCSAWAISASSWASPRDFHQSAAGRLVLEPVSDWAVRPRSEAPSRASGSWAGPWEAQPARASAAHRVAAAAATRRGAADTETKDLGMVVCLLGVKNQEIGNRGGEKGLAPSAHRRWKRHGPRRAPPGAACHAPRLPGAQ